MHPQLLSGTGRAGKGDHVLAIEMVEQIARAAADQADCPLRHQPAINNHFDHRLRQLRGSGSRFDDGRHTGKPGGRQLFQHAPAGEVKGVDMYRYAGF